MTASVSSPSTHEVLNQPPPLEGHNAFDADLALREGLEREGGGWGLDRARGLR
jgi:putative acyl-CoA dehydrogenase